MNEVMDFIKKRFSMDCNWINGNCYYFAIILKDRFPDGEIYYDVVDGHFVLKLQEQYYDWTGAIDCNEKCLVKWDNFEQYDDLQYQRIIRDCIK